MPASTAIVWFRRDLRVHDHPSLHTAVREFERVVPVFVLDDALLGGRFPSPTRTAFMLASLTELAGALRDRGGGLAIRHGRPHEELVTLANETGASAVLWASDVSPYARTRDRRVREALGEAGVEARQMPGNFVADVSRPATQTGKPFTVFSPFWRAWQTLDRRPVLDAPDELTLPSDVRPGRIPALSALGMEPEVEDPPPAGETAARAALDAFLDDDVRDYDEGHDRLAGGSSRLSPALRFGCISAREVEARTTAHAGKGRDAFARQLAWRDFYAHVLLNHPDNARLEYQARYRDLEWDDDEELLDAWRQGRTGFPLVDAGMRQLAATGWMHNRARLVVGSFLTKDLHLDWRAGEAHFMRLLADGDMGNNNGNWQWIASVGVDPAPYFRRMFNPARHLERFDPDGEYVRRWVPELADVPAARLAEPWRMTDEQQEAAGCVIGRDYPAPIVDHAEERRRAMERYRAATGDG